MENIRKKRRNKNKNKCGGFSAGCLSLAIKTPSWTLNPSFRPTHRHFVSSIKILLCSGAAGHNLQGKKTRAWWFQSNLVSDGFFFGTVCIGRRYWFLVFRRKPKAKTETISGTPERPNPLKKSYTQSDQAISEEVGSVRILGIWHHYFQLNYKTWIYPDEKGTHSTPSEFIGEYCKMNLLRSISKIWKYIL